MSCERHGAATGIGVVNVTAHAIEDRPGRGGDLSKHVPGQRCWPRLHGREPLLHGLAGALRLAGDPRRLEDLVPGVECGVCQRVGDETAHGYDARERSGELTIGREIDPAACERREPTHQPERQTPPERCRALRRQKPQHGTLESVARLEALHPIVGEPALQQTEEVVGDPCSARA